jgi:hypothetical protein
MKEWSKRKEAVLQLCYNCVTTVCALELQDKSRMSLVSDTMLFNTLPQ